MKPGYPTSCAAVKIHEVLDSAGIPRELPDLPATDKRLRRGTRTVTLLGRVHELALRYKEAQQAIGRMPWPNADREAREAKVR